MSDSPLRQLERRWKETGTEADEATYLLERLRDDDLSILDKRQIDPHEARRNALEHGFVARPCAASWACLQEQPLARPVPDEVRDHKTGSKGSTDLPSLYTKVLKVRLGRRESLGVTDHH